MVCASYQSLAFFSSSVFLFFYGLARGYAPHECYQACQAKRRAAIDTRFMSSRANTRVPGPVAKLDPDQQPYKGSYALALILARHNQGRVLKTKKKFGPRTAGPALWRSTLKQASITSSKGIYTERARSGHVRQQHLAGHRHAQQHAQDRPRVRAEDPSS